MTMVRCKRGQSSKHHLDLKFQGTCPPPAGPAQEAKRFDGIDKQWARIMTETARNVNVLEACSAEGRLNTLQVRGGGWGGWGWVGEDWGEGKGGGRDGVGVRMGEGIWGWATWGWATLG